MSKSEEVKKIFIIFKMNYKLISIPSQNMIFIPSIKLRFSMQQNKEIKSAPK